MLPHCLLLVLLSLWFAPGQALNFAGNRVSLLLSLLIPVTTLTKHAICPNYKPLAVHDHTMLPAETLHL